MKYLIAILLCIATLPCGFAETEIEFPPLGPVPDGTFLERITFSFGNSATVVDGADSPFTTPNQNAIHVVNDMPAGESQFRLRSRIFRGEPVPVKGKLEIPLRLVEGGVQIDVGGNPDSFDPSSPQTMLLDGDRLYCSLHLIVGEPPGVGFAGRYFRGVTDGVVIIDADTDYLVNFEWDFSPENFAFAVSINGEDLRSADGNPNHFMPTQATEAWQGINALGIFSKNNLKSEYFIRPITHSAETPED